MATQTRKLKQKKDDADVEMFISLPPLSAAQRCNSNAHSTH